MAGKWPEIGETSSSRSSLATHFLLEIGMPLAPICFKDGHGKSTIKVDDLPIGTYRNWAFPAQLLECHWGSHRKIA